MQISLGLSPCPNDTFSFYALLHHKTVFADPLTVRYLDIEALNQACMQQQFEFCKVSFHAYCRLRERYQLLEAGSALGFGCGPLLVARANLGREDAGNIRIGVPGRWTTANLLLRLWAGVDLDLVQMPFDQIMPRVARGDLDAGVIIHESRFTYPDYGLKQVADLGSWWEEETGYPIPLGGIVARRDLPQELVQRFDRALAESIRYGWQHPDEPIGFMRRHAQEMQQEVMAQHVGLYVNRYSAGLGEQGRRAVAALVERATGLPGFIEG